MHFLNSVLLWMRFYDPVIAVSCIFMLKNRFLAKILTREICLFKKVRPMGGRQNGIMYVIKCCAESGEMQISNS